MVLRTTAELVGAGRVVEPAGVLPQAAWRLDPSPPLAPGETLVEVERINLDAASYRQLREEHHDDGDAIREHVRQIIASRGKMHNPVTGSGGMLVGVVRHSGAESPLGLAPGDRIATLVSLTLTPLTITDDLARWDGRSEQIPTRGQAILFPRSVAARLPDDLPTPLALAVLDVCGAPALTRRVVTGHRERGAAPVVAVLGAAGKSGSLALAAARDAGAAHLVGVVVDETEAGRLGQAGLADTVTVADARDPLGLAAAVTDATGGAGADVTVVCVDASGCEHGAILATRDGGTIVFFSMATSFPAAALGAEGFAADVTMLIGNGYLPGHADYALRLLREHPGVRALFDTRLGTG